MQLGFGKAGFDSNDLLDNAAHPSVDRIIDELQHPRVGDCVPTFTKVSDTTAFKIAAINAAESFSGSSPTARGHGNSLRSAGAPAGSRERARYYWERPAEALISVLLMELGDSR